MLKTHKCWILLAVSELKLIRDWIGLCLFRSGFDSEIKRGTLAIINFLWVLMVSGSAAMGKPKKTSRKVDVSCNTANAAVATNVSNACYISLGYDKPVACICSSCLFFEPWVECILCFCKHYPLPTASSCVWGWQDQSWWRWRDSKSQGSESWLETRNTNYPFWDFISEEIWKCVNWMGHNAGKQEYWGK